MPQRRDDPYLNFNFRLEIDSIAIAGFSEAELPEGRIEVVTYREGADQATAPRLLPGRVEYGPVVLRRGFTGDAALFQWWRDAAGGNVQRHNVVVVLEDEQRNDVARWVLRDAWPAKWVGPELRGVGNEVVIETLVLVHEGIELE